MVSGTSRSGVALILSRAMLRARMRCAVVGAVAMLTGMSACAPVAHQDPPPGVRIASTSRQAVEAHVEGRLIRISAPEKQCVFPGSVGVTGGAAHLVIGDCIWHQPRAGAPVLRGVSGREGVFSVTVLGADFPKRGWDAFEGFLRSPDGAKTMQVTEIAEIIRDDLGIFVVTEDLNGGQDVICRAYTELNGRLAVVSLLNSPVGEDVPAMRARLSDVIASLQAQNQRLGRTG
ncbi:MAG: hypothetical protein ACPGSI_05950 [Pikeienuella sp.]